MRSKERKIKIIKSHTHTYEHILGREDRKIAIMLSW